MILKKKNRLPIILPCSDWEKLTKTPRAGRAGYRRWIDCTWCSSLAHLGHSLRRRSHRRERCRPGRKTCRPARSWHSPDCSRTSRRDHQQTARHERLGLHQHRPRSDCFRLHLVDREWIKFSNTEKNLHWSLWRVSCCCLFLPRQSPPSQSQAELLQALSQ